LLKKSVTAQDDISQVRILKEGKIKRMVIRVQNRTYSGNQFKQIKINSHGNLVIPRKIVETVGFQIGDVLKLKKTKIGIVITK
jgi:hypothetical protein